MPWAFRWLVFYGLPRPAKNAGLAMTNVGSFVTSKKCVQVVIGILQCRDTFLIAERPVGRPYSGYWEFPGGKIEKNESSEAALKRELFEELGIEVVNAEMWFEHEHAYPDKIVRLHVWLVTAFKGEPQSKEGQVLRWVSLPEIMDLRVLEGNYVIFERMRQSALIFPHPPSAPSSGGGRLPD